MRALFREYLRLGRGERAGWLILTFLLLLFLAYRFWLAELLFPPDHAFIAGLIRQAEAAERSAGTQDSLNKRELFVFDPNKASVEELKMLGVPEKLALRIQKYLAAGGRFKKPEDLGRIYGFPPALLDTILPFVAIRETAGSKKTYTRPPVPEKTHSAAQTPISFVELNSADSTGLDGLKGIGPVLASRILKYRQKLGGFVSIAQLSEVYGLDDEKLRAVKDQVILDTLNIRRLDLNRISEDSLRLHPYLSYQLARSIIRYREQHGYYSSAEELRSLHPMSDSTLRRLVPYLEFSD